MIKAIEEPEKGWHVIKLGAPVIALVKAFNALRKLQFKASHRWFFSWDEGGAIIEYIPTAGEAAADVTFPWQPYLSPFVGLGLAPADQGRRIRIRPATVSGVLPSNLNVEIVVPPSQTNPYFVWLEASLSVNGDVLGVSYNHGSSLPGQPAVIDDGNGSVPGTAYVLLFAVTSTEASVNLPPVIQNQNTALNLKPVPIKVAMSTTGAQVSQRKLEWTPPGSVTSFDGGS